MIGVGDGAGAHEHGDCAAMARLLLDAEARSLRSRPLTRRAARVDLSPLGRGDKHGRCMRSLIQGAAHIDLTRLRRGDNDRGTSPEPFPDYSAAAVSCDTLIGDSNPTLAFRRQNGKLLTARAQRAT